MSKLPKPPKGQRIGDVRTSDRTVTYIRAGRLDDNSPSKPVEIAVDWTDGGDRNILETYPEVDSFQRYHIPGEFWPVVYPVNMIVDVVRISGNARILVPNPNRPTKKSDYCTMIAIAEGTEDQSELIDYMICERHGKLVWVSLQDFEAVMKIVDGNGDGHER